MGVYEPDAARRRALEASGEHLWSQARWIDDKGEILEDPTIAAVSSEGMNNESLDQTEEIVDAGKHVFYDKPAGDDYAQFERVVAKAREKGLLIQLGYMFRCHDGFERIAGVGQVRLPGARLFGARADGDARGREDACADR